MRNFRCQRVGKFIFTQRARQKISSLRSKCGNSSVGRAQPCQGWGREFEPRFPLLKDNHMVVFFFVCCWLNFRCQRVGILYVFLLFCSVFLVFSIYNV